MGENLEACWHQRKKEKKESQKHIYIYISLIKNIKTRKHCEKACLLAVMKLQCLHSQRRDAPRRVSQCLRDRAGHDMGKKHCGKYPRKLW